MVANVFVIRQTQSSKLGWLFVADARPSARFSHKSDDVRLRPSAAASWMLGVADWGTGSGVMHVRPSQ